MKKIFLSLFAVFQIFSLFFTHMTASAEGLSINHVFPIDDNVTTTVGGITPIIADIVTDTPDETFWRVYDSAGTLDEHGSGDSICLKWNTRLIEDTNATVTIETWTESQSVTAHLNVFIDHEIGANPSITQLSSNVPDTEKMFCGGNLHRGSQRVGPNSQGDIVAFMSNAYTDVTIPFYNEMPICELCEIFTNTPDGNNLIQLTSNPSAQELWKTERVDTDDSGRYIVFTSSADLLGLNPQGVQQAYYLDAQTSQLRQLTFFTDGECAERCSVSGDGRWIVFNANSNYLGTNPNKLKQIFIIHRTGNYLTQLTFGTDGETRTPAISKNGRMIAFASSHDLLGLNPNHLFQIFVMRSNGRRLRQLTLTDDKHNSRPQIDRNGEKVVYLQHTNEPLQGPIGLGADIVTINTDGTDKFKYTNVSENDVQLRPDISEDGSIIAWESTANLVGSNADRSREIYVSHTNQYDYKQITNAQVWHLRWKNVLCQRPYLNETGSMVFFECTADLKGENPDLWLQVFSSPTGY